MGRKKINIDPIIEEEITKVKEKITLAEEYLPLIFDETNITVLAILLKARHANGLPFSRIGEEAEIGKSQKLATVLNTLRNYSLIYKTNGNYDLTEIGVAAAEVAERLVTIIHTKATQTQKVNMPTMQKGYQIFSKYSKLAEEQAKIAERVRRSP